ncbi:MAG: Mg-chelatase subunit ChlD [Cryomorphaceae bacterium]|jgi:Mg-chelatase subunit ChlD
MNKLNTIIVGASVSCLASGISSLMAKPGDMGKPDIVDILNQQKTVEVCFVLDTTGSMGGLISGAKQKIWSIANQIAQRQDSPKIRFSLVAYRDRGDSYVTQLTDLNEDLDVVHDKLMKYQAAGGGDSPESVNQALHEAVTKLKWTKGGHVTRIVFLVGDAPPHMDYKQDIDYTVTCKLAQKKGITINAIQCGVMKETILPWQHIAKLGSGKYIALPQDGGVVAISCPQDKPIADLTLKLNLSVIPYGSLKRQEQAKWKVDNSNKLLGKDAKINSTRAACLSSHKGSYRAFLGDNDLVSEWGDKKVTLKNLKQEHLPEEFKKLSKEKLVKLLDDKIKSRVKIKADMDTLIGQREKYIAKETAKNASGKGATKNAFDESVQSLLKEQIK